MLVEREDEYGGREGKSRRRERRRGGRDEYQIRSETGNDIRLTKD